MARLDFLVEQLWASPLADERLRLAVDEPESPDWRDVESYWLVPDAQRATLLVPRGHPRVTAASIDEYRSLRPIHVAAAKRAVGLAARARMPASRHRLSLRVRRDAPAEVAATLPLATLEHLLGQAPLAAAIGVRTGDNRKPTLALFAADGAPVGFAKIGWDTGSDAQVANEAAVLREIGTDSGLAAVPQVLATGEYAGHPVLVTSPLPREVRGGRRGIRPPTPHEIVGLMPLRRHGPLESTTQVRRLSGSLESLAVERLTGSVAGPARRLLADATAENASLPISARWHGDFTEWNLARDGEDRLWVWDWESSEPDAVAGLDALHWVLSHRRLRVDDMAEIDLAACLADAREVLHAIGIARGRWPVVAATYVVTVVERACALAASRATWEESWISQSALHGLIGQAGALLGAMSPAE
jgi:hypothetical protein